MIAQLIITLEVFSNPNNYNRTLCYYTFTFYLQVTKQIQVLLHVLFAGDKANSSSTSRSICRWQSKFKFYFTFYLQVTKQIQVLLHVLFAGDKANSSSTSRSICRWQSKFKFAVKPQLKLKSVSYLPAPTSTGRITWCAPSKRSPFLHSVSVVGIPIITHLR